MEFNLFTATPQLSNR